MLTDNFKTVKLPGKGGQLVTHINGHKAPEHLRGLRIPPAGTMPKVDPDPAAACVATWFDAAGRKQRAYSPDHKSLAKSSKFERVRALLGEWEDIRTQIEEDINNPDLGPSTKEAALVAYLIYETGIRVGGENPIAEVKAYGATTLQLKHVKPCSRGVRLKFVGKKGVPQNVLVTNPHLVEEFVRRKNATTAYTSLLFDCSAGLVRGYFAMLGSGIYTPKDFRTARGTSLALELLGNRKRLPKAKSHRKRLVNAALDKVAKQLGNTRAVSKSAYVDPLILERFLN